MQDHYITPDSQSQTQAQPRFQSTNFIDRPDFHEDISQEVEFTILNPPTPEADLVLELERWRTMVGYCTAQVRRLEELIEGAT